MNDNERIFQIIPASGWIANAKYENKGEPDIFEPIHAESHLVLLPALSGTESCS